MESGNIFEYWKGYEFNINPEGGKIINDLDLNKFCIFFLQGTPFHPAIQSLASLENAILPTLRVSKGEGCVFAYWNKGACYEFIPVPLQAMLSRPAICSFVSLDNASLPMVRVSKGEQCVFAYWNTKGHVKNSSPLFYRLCCLARQSVPWSVLKMPVHQWSGF